MNFDIHFEHNVRLNMKDECLQIQENAVLTRNQFLFKYYDSITGILCFKNSKETSKIAKINIFCTTTHPNDQLFLKAHNIFAN